MTASTPARRLRLWRAVAAPAAVLVLLALAGTASGSAEVGNFHSEEPFSDTITDYPCFEGVVGTISGTETIDGRFTEKGPPAFGFHASGSTVDDYRVDFPDGRYVVGVGKRTLQLQCHSATTHHRHEHGSRPRDGLRGQRAAHRAADDPRHVPRHVQRRQRQRRPTPAS